MKNHFFLLPFLAIFLITSCSQLVEEKDHTHQVIFQLNGADTDQTIKELERRSKEYFNSTMTSKVNGDTLTVTLGVTDENKDVSRLGLTANLTFEFPVYDQSLLEVLMLSIEQNRKLFSEGQSRSEAEVKRKVLQSLTDSLAPGVTWLHHKEKLSDQVFFNIKPVLSDKSVEFGSWIESVKLTSSETDDIIEIEFNEIGTDRWTHISEENVEKMVHIVLDQEIITSPLIREKISEGKISIYLPAKSDDNNIKDLVQQLQSGRLSNKVSLETVSLIK